jgi:hypothetical protein
MTSSSSSTIPTTTTTQQTPTIQMGIIIISISMFIIIVAGRVGFIVYQVNAGFANEMTHYNEIFMYVLLIAMIPPGVGIIAAKDEIQRNAQRIRML